MSDALKRQVGGDHYKRMGIQPLELTYKNFGYLGLLAAVYCKVNKYMLREKDDHVENIEKAIHCLEILHDIALSERETGGATLNEEEIAICEMMADEMGLPFDMIAREFNERREEVHQNAKRSPPAHEEVQEDDQGSGHTPPTDGKSSLD